VAAPTATDKRIEIGLRSLGRTLRALPEVARAWADMSDGERASWSLDWDQLMGTYLRLLERHYRVGTLTRDQQARYRVLLSKLEAVGPLIARLDLYPPPVLPAS